MITRRDFTKALSLLPLAGVVPVFPMPEYVYDLKKPESFEDEYRQLLWNDHPIGYPNDTAKWSEECLMDLARQLKEMVYKNPRCIYFVPHSKDEKAFSDGLNKQHYMARREDHIIGELTEVKFDTDGQDFKFNKLQSLGVKFQIDEQFRHLPLRFYTLAIGTDPDSIVFEDYNLDEMYKQNKYNFTIKSCKINGLHFTMDRHPNYPWEDHLKVYYKLRGFNMFVYLPGRCYW